MNDVLTFIISRINYFIYIILMVLGMYGIIVKNNLLKKIIGMNILQTAIILFFISIGAKNKATVPIVEHAHGAENHAIHAVNYINPLPHVLMLTAIVVAVATLGVALALIIGLYRQYNTLEEDEILAQLKEG
ncbi:MAG: cation:proton antiporter subunit C [Deltaproteobacteria bacterium]|nr:cation:proton antiporter subunit C [Deltaproteobacteria bacterium]